MSDGAILSGTGRLKVSCRDRVSAVRSKSVGGLGRSVSSATKGRITGPDTRRSGTARGGRPTRGGGTPTAGVRGAASGDRLEGGASVGGGPSGPSSGRGGNSRGGKRTGAAASGGTGQPTRTADRTKRGHPGAGVGQISSISPGGSGSGPIRGATGAGAAAGTPTGSGHPSCNRGSNNSGPHDRKGRKENGGPCGGGGHSGFGGNAAGRKPTMPPHGFHRLPRAFICASNVGMVRITGGLRHRPTRVVGGLFLVNVVIARGRTLKGSTLRLLTTSCNVRTRRGVIRSVSSLGDCFRVRRGPRRLISEPPIIAVVNRISRNGAALLSSLHGAGMVRARTNKVARRVNTCRIGVSKGPVAFLSAPKRTTFAAVHTHKTSIASVAVVIITTSSNIVPRAVRTVGRTGTTSIPVVITIGGVSGPATGPSHIVRRLSSRNLIPRT